MTDILIIDGCSPFSTNLKSQSECISSLKLKNKAETHDEEAAADRGLTISQRLISFPVQRSISSQTTQYNVDYQDSLRSMMASVPW